ncbi:LemA family protein [Patescibacteria group bacterium]|nr:LemA family protein [Patescibacteria group bacterium]MBU1028776.1 LemA family protein [Patescibacteria group bacterium]
MSSLTIITIVVLGLVLLLAMWIILVYNGLITLRNRVDEAWSDIDVQLKRRYDLIPNLIETVKSYATHERETLERVVAARTAAMGAENKHDKAEAENALSQTLKSLFAIAENYPDLKASQNFLQMQDDLKDTEDKIQAARRFYNANVRDFNTKVQVFPNNVIAGQLKFRKYEFFEIENKEQRENVQVKF